MVKTVLREAGFIENITFKETRFVNPPDITFAVFQDSFERRGADNCNLITEHEYTIEVYSLVPDPDAEKNLENALDTYGITYHKDERYWIQAEQMYQVIYTFTHIEK